MKPEVTFSRVHRNPKNPEHPEPVQEATHSTRKFHPNSNLTKPMLSKEKMAVPKKREKVFQLVTSGNWLGSGISYRKEI